MKKRVLFIGIYLFIFCSPALSLTLSEILPPLLNKHELIKAAEARRNQAYQRIKQIVANKYPQLNLSVQGAREYINFPGDIPRSIKTKNIEAVTLEQLISDFGLTDATFREAKAAYEQAKAQLEAIRQQVMFQGALAFLNLIKTREQLKYALKSEKRIKDLTGMEEIMLKKGAGVSSNVLQVKARLAGARALRVRTEGEYILAKNRFKSIFKYLPTDEEIATFTLPRDVEKKLPPSLNEAIAWALKNNPKIRMGKFALQAARYAYMARKRVFFPKLSLFGNLIRRENDDGITGIRKDAVLGIKLDYNIFAGGRDLATRNMAYSSMISTQEQLQNLKNKVEEEVRNAWQNLLTYKANYKLLQNQANIVNAFLKLAIKERKLGTRTLLDVLSGELEYINAQSNAVASKVDTIAATYNLYYAMGKFNIELF